MDNSILNTIKKMLGLSEDYVAFDADIIVHINSALMSVQQLGIGPTAGMAISDSSATWGSLLGDRENLEAVKSFIYIKVRLVFDPPSSSFVLQALKEDANELEWRLREQAEDN